MLVLHCKLQSRQCQDFERSRNIAPPHPTPLTKQNSGLRKWEKHEQKKLPTKIQNKIPSVSFASFVPFVPLSPSSPCVPGPLQSIRRPRDVIYFLQAMTNSFHTSIFAKCTMYIAYSWAPKLCEFIVVALSNLLLSAGHVWLATLHRQVSRNVEGFNHKYWQLQVEGPVGPNF